MQVYKRCFLSVFAILPLDTLWQVIQERPSDSYGDSRYSLLVALTQFEWILCLNMRLVRALGRAELK